MLKYIHWPVFIFSFIVGIIFVYILGPDKKMVYVYPTPFNTSTYQFRDNAENCYEFKSSKTTCPSNPLLIHTVPVQN